MLNSITGNSFAHVFSLFVLTYGLWRRVANSCQTKKKRAWREHTEHNQQQSDLHKKYHLKNPSIYKNNFSLHNHHWKLEICFLGFQSSCRVHQISSDRCLIPFFKYILNLSYLFDFLEDSKSVQKAFNCTAILLQHTLESHYTMSTIQHWMNCYG